MLVSPYLWLCLFFLALLLSLSNLTNDSHHYYLLCIIQYMYQYIFHILLFAEGCMPMLPLPPFDLSDH